MSISYKQIKRPAGARLRFAAIQSEVAKQVDGIGRLQVNERKRITANFETDIEFGYEVKVSSVQVTLNILLKNDGTAVSDDFTVGDLWKALDTKGSPPHTIRPRTLGPGFGGTLKFQWGGPGSYQPKTRPVGRFGGPGRVNRGETVYPRQVNHPGFPPRKFSEGINKRLRPAYLKAISRGTSIGWQKIK